MVEEDAGPVAKGQAGTAAWARQGLDKWAWVKHARGWGGESAGGDVSEVREKEANDSN